MRYIWTGNLSFGLINIPIGLVTASRDHELKFTLLHKKDHSEIRYARICKEEEKEIPYDQIVKGIARGGHYKILSDADFKKAEGEKSRSIDISVFCDEAEVDSLYYEKPYFLKPQKGGEKAYALLHRALGETGKVAIAEYAFKNHSQLAAIKPYEGLLVLNQMRYHSQIVKIHDIDIKAVKVAPKEVEMAKELVLHLSGHFYASKYHDKYIENLEKVIKKKAGTSKGVTSKEPHKPSAKVYDIMTLLKESLQTGKTRSKKPERR